MTPQLEAGLTARPVIDKRPQAHWTSPRHRGAVAALSPVTPISADKAGTPEKNDPSALSNEEEARWTVAALIQEELPRLRRFARILARDAELAEDLLQDTIVRALTYAYLWRPGTFFWAWIKTVMRNKFYTDCERRTRLRTLLPMNDGERSIAPLQFDKIACREIHFGIGKLSKPQRTTMLLAVFEEMNSDEIATRMGISANAVRCHLTRARKELRKHEMLEAR